MGALDVGELQSHLAALEGAQLGSAHHTTLPPTLGPIGWQAGIARLTAQHPFRTNVFLMTRFPKKEDKADPLHRVIEITRVALADHGLTLHLASDRVIDENLLGNIAAHMWACQFGIGIFEDRARHGLNYNVLIEIGAMIMAGRRCVLLKDTSAPSMPIDLVGHIYKPVDVTDDDAVSAEVHAWARGDLSLGQCSNCASI
jgi:hypothetical protein